MEDMKNMDCGCHWCGADAGEPCHDDCPSWDIITNKKGTDQ